MDIFADYNNALLERFNADSYLSSGVPAKLYSQDQLAEEASDEDTDETRKNLINTTLNTNGIAGILSTPKVISIEGDRMKIQSIIEWAINKKVNASSTGSNKPGGKVTQQSVALLQRYIIAITNESNERVDPYTMIFVKEAGEDDEVSGLWRIRFETMISVQVVTS